MLSHSILISIPASSASVHQVMMQKTVKPAQDMRLEQRWEICILLVDIKIPGYTNFTFDKSILAAAKILSRLVFA
jgi:hypothetical protein